MNKAVKEFITNIENDSKRSDAEQLVELMEKESGYQAYLTGSIIGFGRYHYQYDSGRQGDSIVVGFSPRKQNFAIYIMPGFSDYQEILASLGKHKTGKSCLYINKLADVDVRQLGKLIHRSVKTMKEKYVCKNVL